MEHDEPKTERDLIADRLDYYVIETNIRKAVLALIDPVLEKMNTERENLEKLRKQTSSQNNRIGVLEAALFESKSNSQFDEIRGKITNIEKERREKEVDVESAIALLRTDFNQVQFNLHNYCNEMAGMKGTISLMKEHFK